MSIRDTALNVAAFAVAVSAVIIAGVALMSFLNSTRQRTVERGRLPPERVEGWEKLKGTGHQRGPDSSDVTVVVFSDFECPACAAFATRTYPRFVQRFPGRVSLVYRHWPLDSHPHAYPAAVASECAAQQDRFWAFHDSIYGNQRQLGVRSFAEIADRVGVPDVKAFRSCLGSDLVNAAVERDIAVVQALGGIGTPTVIVNGWLLRGGVDGALLDSISE